MPRKRFNLTSARISLVVLISLASVTAGDSLAAAPATNREQIRDAVEVGLRLLEKSMATYPEHRTCFSCHHQTLPMQAMITARKHKFTINETLLNEQTRLTQKFFKGRADDLKDGTGIGGKYMTVGFGLWTLQLANCSSDDTTSAMVDYLLKGQDKDGRFPSTSVRPPLEDSPFTGTMVAAYNIRKFIRAPKRDDIERAVISARQWLIDTQPKSQEDRNSRLWGLHLLDAKDEEVSKARTAVLEAQRPDGGWSQLADMESDAYATGQTLFVLQETGTAVDDAPYQRGVRHLLGSRLPDGSWRVTTRSKPIQTYFESGFPHGKDQFISICATSWAVAALAAAY